MRNLIARLRGHLYSKVIAAALVGFAAVVVNVAAVASEVYPGSVAVIVTAVATVVAAYLKREAKTLDPSTP